MWLYNIAIATYASLIRTISPWNEKARLWSEGRKGIFEIFEIDDTIQRLIFDHAPSSVLRERAREMGMRTLREDGMLKVASGMTSLKEVLQATMGDAD